MARKGSEEVCGSVEAAFTLIAKKWTALIINALLDGERYFCELEKAIPALSARVLALRIRELEKEGIVSRRVGASSPIRVSYSLTDKGRALEPIIRDIARWARTWSGPVRSADRTSSLSGPLPHFTAP
ncbi:MAG TPA: helix-turn-helix domain-containing protein [Rectinemataceae bacterium]|nr:helix-turn-helix domain-containing protein [Rectinemataceae bacterium]